MVNTTSARKARKRAQGQGAQYHWCQVPSVLQQQGKRWGCDSATECEVELLDGGRIVSNILKTKREHW